MDIEYQDAFEQVTGDAASPFVLTCEHASERLPEPWCWPAADRWLVGTHWAYDIGASELTRDVCQSLAAPAVLARFSRLLVDPNRALDSDTLFREVAEGRPVELNVALPPAQRVERIARLYEPFHQAVARCVEQSAAAVVLAMHTFTPLYEGQTRALEVGVLFDEDEALARRVQSLLRAEGLRTELNEPYSGKAGLMYVADRHARRFGRQALELEVRQDLAVQADVRRRIVSVLEQLAREL